MSDPAVHRAESREAWEAVAGGWERSREVLRRATMPVTAWLLEAAELQPGHVVLDVAAGTGDVGLMAAELVAPDGRAIVTDGAEAMVEAARRRAQELGVTNAEVRAMEAEWLDLPAASVDAVLCRWGLMLFVDREAALREARRVLRPGGRIALAVWDAPERNPWIGLIGPVLVEGGWAQPPPPDAPGPFALADPGRVEALLAGAGFDDVVVDAVELTFQAPSLDAWWEHQHGTSSRLRAATKGLSPAEHTRLRDAVDAAYARYVRPDGSVRFPARTLVAAASA